MDSQILNLILGLLLGGAALPALRFWPYFDRGFSR